MGARDPSAPWFRHLCQTLPVLRGKVSRSKSATEFPRKCSRCVKIERQNLLGKIVAATEFPGDRISCDRGYSVCHGSVDEYFTCGSYDSTSELYILLLHPCPPPPPLFRAWGVSLCPVVTGTAWCVGCCS